jgi:hypothetical protein
MGHIDRTDSFHTLHATWGLADRQNIIIPATSDIKKGMESLVTAFTDHLAVVLHMTIHIPHATRGKGLWRMNVSYVVDTHFTAILTEACNEWRSHKRHYPTCIMWWNRLLKERIRNIFSRYGA